MCRRYGTVVYTVYTATYMLTYQMDLVLIACFLKKNTSCPFAMKSILQGFI